MQRTWRPRHFCIAKGRTSHDQQSGGRGTIRITSERHARSIFGPNFANRARRFLAHAPAAYFFMSVARFSRSAVGGAGFL